MSYNPRILPVSLMASQLCNTDQFLRTRPSVMGEQGNIIGMYICMWGMQISQTRRGRTAFVLDSYDKSIPLV